MKSMDQWFAEYGESHRNKTNILIHKICVPAIMFTIIGILWSLPRPDFFPSPWVNWATVFIAFCMVFYFMLGIKPAIFMLVEVTAMCWFANYLAVSTGMLMEICIAGFAVAWIFQFVGHQIEGKKPSFLQDLQFLLVGPLWIMKGLLK